MVDTLKEYRKLSEKTLLKKRKRNPNLNLAPG